MTEDMCDLFERYTATKIYKDRWLALYKDLYFYVIPDRDAFNVKFNYNDNGKPTTAMAWDTTAITAAYTRANDLHGLLLPMDRVWGQAVMDHHRWSSDQINAFKPRLDECNSNTMFYINRSNLHRVVADSNLDVVGGSAGLWIESHSDEDPLYFRSIPAVCLYIEYSTDDILNTAWFQSKLTGRYCDRIFKDYKGTKKSAFKEYPNDLFVVVYGQIKLRDDKYYLYAFLEEDPYNLLFETERSYPQMLIYRDRVRPGESDGRGIGLDMLPTIRDLNRTVEYNRKSLAFKAYPPLFADSKSLFNPYSVQQWAGSILMRDANKPLPLEAMKMPDSPDTFDTIKDLQQTIINAFQVDPLGEITSPVKSATEISIRENRAQRTASTDISRLINELPAQIYKVCAQILGERRLLTRDRKVSKLNMAKLEFEFQSPLYDLQKQDDLTHFITNLQVKQQFLGQDAALASLNLMEVQNFLTDVLNLKSKLFKSQDELKQVFGGIVKAYQAQQNAQNQPKPTTAPITPQTPQASQVQF